MCNYIVYIIFIDGIGTMPDVRQIGIHARGVYIKYK